MDQNVGFDMQVVYIEKNLKFNIADKWLISLDHVTYFMPINKSLYLYDDGPLFEAEHFDQNPAQWSVIVTGRDLQKITWMIPSV